VALLEELAVEIPGFVALKVGHVQLLGSGRYSRISALSWPTTRTAWNMAVGSPWANFKWVASTKSVGRVASKARQVRGWALGVGEVSGGFAAGRCVGGRLRWGLWGGGGAWGWG